MKFCVIVIIPILFKIWRIWNFHFWVLGEIFVSFSEEVTCKNDKIRAQIVLNSNFNICSWKYFHHWILVDLSKDPRKKNFPRLIFSFPFKTFFSLSSARALWSTSEHRLLQGWNTLRTRDLSIETWLQGKQT